MSRRIALHIGMYVRMYVVAAGFVCKQVSDKDVYLEPEELFLTSTLEAGYDDVDDASSPRKRRLHHPMYI